LAGGTVEVRGHVGAAGGLLALRGKGKLGSEPRYRIEGAVTPATDLAALLGARTSSGLAAPFVVDGRGTRRETLRGSARLSAKGWYGSPQRARAHLDLDLISGTARLAGRGYVDGASVELGAVARPFDA